MLVTYRDSAYKLIIQIFKFDLECEKYFNSRALINLSLAL